MSERPTIYAVDFDGTLCENAWPYIGKPNTALIDFLKDEQRKGNVVILWTMREGELLEQAQDWLFDKFHFAPDIVNDNIPLLQEKYHNNPRKIYADVYIDDHNARTGVCADLPFGEPVRY